jgi:CBS domain-containing protein
MHCRKHTGDSLPADDLRDRLAVMLAGPKGRALDFARAHGRTARDVMTRAIVTVPEDAPLGEIAALLEEHRIKRVPVVRDGEVVGVVK